MSPLLDQANAEVQKITAGQQVAIATIILEEIEVDRRWEESFARSPSKLKALVAHAEEQVQAGQCRAAGFDEL